MQPQTLCGGSTLPCSSSYKGELGPPNVLTCSDREVVVGVEVVYAEPVEMAGGSDPGYAVATYDGLQDGAPRDGPQSPRSIWIPGAVYGISKVFCANAEKVAGGDNAPTKVLHATVVAPDDAKSARLLAEPGAWAFNGASPAYSRAGTAQIIFSYRPFTADSTAAQEMTTAPYPSTLAPGSVPTGATVGCLGGALFVGGLVWRPTAAAAPELGGLSVVCVDYADVFATPDSNKVACCMGKGGHCAQDGYLPQTAKCDGLMRSFCGPLCADGSCANPVCACVGSPLAPDGLPQCFDSRCADNAGAYRLAGMPASACKNQSLSCAGWEKLGRGRYVAKGVAVPAGCAPPPFLAWLRKNPLVVVAILILVILLAFGLTALSRRQKRALRLPPGALPALPSLAQL